MQYIVPAWPAPQNIHAYTTTRQQGVSTTPYASFNLAHHVGDEEQHVSQNRKLLATILNLPTDPIWLQQVHGNTVLLPRSEQEYDYPQADAIVATDPNIVCAVLTADCLPILICNKKGTCVSAVHAGWRGLANGILQQTIEKICENPQELLVWLGPAIGPNTFEISNDVRDIFIQQNIAFEYAFKPLSTGKWLANLYQLATIQLNELGITAIFGGEFCTFQEHDKFYSYRREQGVTGRMATLIWLSA